MWIAVLKIIVRCIDRLGWAAFTQWLMNLDLVV